MSSSLNKGILITIICEAVLQDRLISLIKKLDVSGYTISPTQGSGSHGRRMSDIPGYNTNIELKIIVTTEISEKLFTELKSIKSTHALIAFQQNIEGLFE